MKERRILFSAPMVQAILAGTKMQTRRVVKPQPKLITLIDGSHSFAVQKSKGIYNGLGMKEMVEQCPYGQVGDQLWVRETWQPWRQTSVEYNQWEPLSVRDYDKSDSIEYKATSDSLGPWKPSIHMPRKASRIQLEITAVRVERLNEISEEDAIAEGIEPIGYCNKTNRVHHWKTYTDATKKTCWNPVDSYSTLWESINGTGSWAANPFCWVIEFRRINNA